MKEIANLCFNLNIIELVSYNSLKSIRHIIHGPNVKDKVVPSIFTIINAASSSSDARKELSQLQKDIQNEMKTKVASFRTVMMKKPQLRSIILS